MSKVSSALPQPVLCLNSRGRGHLQPAGRGQNLRTMEPPLTPPCSPPPFPLGPGRPSGLLGRVHLHLPMPHLHFPHFIFSHWQLKAVSSLNLCPQIPCSTAGSRRDQAACIPSSCAFSYAGTLSTASPLPQIRRSFLFFGFFMIWDCQPHQLCCCFPDC